MNREQFVCKVVEIAKGMGCSVKPNRDGLDQINFGHKNLHVGHLEAMFPRVLEEGVNIGKVIYQVAPGRSCTHRPMKEIIKRMKASGV